ncbi:MAG: hypothetical protein AAF989_03505 [Planctomycetota bacterium]
MNTSDKETSLKPGDPANQGIQSDENRDPLRWLWSVGPWILMAATWRLWIPAAAAEYPMVSWPSGLDEFARGIGMMATLVVLVSLTVLMFGQIRRGRSVVNQRWWWGVAIGFSLGFLVDQHRLQPWAYQAAMYAIIFACMNSTTSRRWLVPLAASVYIYSAAGKLDFLFAHTVGQDFLTTLLRPFGGFSDAWDADDRAKIALLLPVGELIIGIGLFARRTRPIAGMVAMGMHLTLIGILGPWALNHSWGVLLWNVVLLVQAWLLFVRSRASLSDSVVAKRNDVSSPNADSRQGMVRWFVPRCVVIVAIVMPLFERAGYWDHWLSWSLYSPHASRVDVEFFRDDVAKLPVSVRSCVEEDVDGDGWQRLPLSAWSLRSRHVPVYPQARYQVALTRKLGLEHGVDSGVRVIVRSVSDRWTGERQETWIKGLRNLPSR